MRTIRKRFSDAYSNIIRSYQVVFTISACSTFLAVINYYLLPTGLDLEPRIDTGAFFKPYLFLNLLFVVAFVVAYTRIASEVKAPTYVELLRFSLTKAVPLSITILFACAVLLLVLFFVLLMVGAISASLGISPALIFLSQKIIPIVLIFLPFVIPITVFFVFVSFVQHVCTLQSKYYYEALRLSKRYASSKFWYILAHYFLFFLFTVLIAFFATWAGLSDTEYEFFLNLIFFFVAPFLAFYYYELYIDVKAHYEAQGGAVEETEKRPLI
jgi:hypothetical protein